MGAPKETAQDPKVLIPRRIDFVKSKAAGGASATSVDADGAPKPAYHLFDPAEASALVGWKKPRRAGSGLRNVGNTCYLNSVTQALTYTSPLANYLLEKKHSAECERQGWCAMCVLEKQVCKAHQSGGAFTPEFVHCLKQISKTLRPRRQEDAHEFLRHTLDRLCDSLVLDKKALPPLVSQTTFVHQLFGGQLRSQIRCLKCDYRSSTYDPFLDLSLELERCSSVDKAMSSFTQVELLRGGNQYRCKKCKVLVDAKKQFLIHRPPQILTVQLKRFAFFSRFANKVNKYVEFPLVLDIAKHTTSPKQKHEYKLYAVLVHEGRSAGSGHYFVYCKAANGLWYLFNDEYVKQVPEHHVLKQRAYLLFYERLGGAPAEAAKKAEKVATATTLKAVATPQKPAARPDGDGSDAKASAPPKVSDAGEKVDRSEVKVTPVVDSEAAEVARSAARAADRAARESEVGGGEEERARKAPVSERSVPLMPRRRCKLISPMLPKASRKFRNGAWNRMVRASRGMLRLRAEKDMFRKLMRRRRRRRRDRDEEEEEEIASGSETESADGGPAAPPAVPAAAVPVQKKLMKTQKLQAEERISKARALNTQYATAQVVRGWDDDGEPAPAGLTTRSDGFKEAMARMAPQFEKRDRHDWEYDQGKKKHKPKKEKAVGAGKAAFDDAQAWKASWGKW